MDILIALCIGIGLSAATGFRIFIPPLLMSAAAVTGHYTPPNELTWMATQTALMAFAGATAVEVIAYYIPWIDNLLDMVEVPLAAIAGTVLTAGMLSGAVTDSFPELSPLILWTAAAIVGGGTAAATEGATVVTRLASTATTGGLANPALSTAENLSAMIMTWLAIAAPILALGLVVFVIWYAVTRGIRLLTRRRAHSASHSQEFY
ncbi:MAG: DUF4126 domain-containing protein [Thainema sp.]